MEREGRHSSGGGFSSCGSRGFSSHRSSSSHRSEGSSFGSGRCSSSRSSSNLSRSPRFTPRTRPSVPPAPPRMPVPPVYSHTTVYTGSGAHCTDDDDFFCNYHGGSQELSSKGKLGSEVAIRSSYVIGDELGWISNSRMGTEGMDYFNEKTEQGRIC